MGRDICIKSGFATQMQAQNLFVQRDDIPVAFIIFPALFVAGGNPLLVFRERKTVFGIEHFHHLHGGAKTTYPKLIVIVLIFFRNAEMIEYRRCESLVTHTEQRFLIGIVIVEARLLNIPDGIQHRSRPYSTALYEFLTSFFSYFQRFIGSFGSGFPFISVIFGE